MPTRTRAQGASLDVAQLATTFDHPADEIQSLLDAPTAQLVKDFLESVAAKVQEFDSLNAAKVKSEVELENVVRSSDAKLKAQKSTISKHAKEVEDLRAELNETESAREGLATELESLRSSSTGSLADAQTLRQRIETLEASNRDTLDRKSVV